ncbi:hypothetical protein RvY_03133 [Ramazzottius varieornatus]|uniref:Uncharacterized protein n=1 Tax=Ramazzottius varieornatus TaxID=947166 RepID=A0A1D1ULZ7_RAMVA|nr:hypothetical protein RvY_03133 [Ramazzottius varieornatus]
MQANHTTQSGHIRDTWTATLERDVTQASISFGVPITPKKDTRKDPACKPGPFTAITPPTHQSILKNYHGSKLDQNLAKDDPSSEQEAELYLEFDQAVKLPSSQYPSKFTFVSLDEAINDLVRNQWNIPVQMFPVYDERLTSVNVAQAAHEARRTRSPSQATGEANHIELPRRKEPATRPKKPHEPGLPSSLPVNLEQDVTVLERRSSKTVRTPPQKEVQSTADDQSEEAAYQEDRLRQGMDSRDEGPGSQPTSFRVCQDPPTMVNNLEVGSR